MVKTGADNMARNFQSEDDYRASIGGQVAAHCFTKWTGVKMLYLHEGVWHFEHEGYEGATPENVLADAIGCLEWLQAPPEYPVRLDAIGDAKACAADLSDDFTFDSWLACENHWQAYHATNDGEMLRAMAEILYNKEGITLTEAESLGVFYWWLGVKAMAARMFPNFLRPAEGESEAPADLGEQMRQNINSQLRALTKGDITKEAQILSMNALRALTELDALAREYEELNKKYPTK